MELRVQDSEMPHGLGSGMGRQLRDTGGNTSMKEEFLQMLGSSLRARKRIPSPSY